MYIPLLDLSSFGVGDISVWCSRQDELDAMVGPDKLPDFGDLYKLAMDYMEGITHEVVPHLIFLISPKATTYLETT